MKIPFLAIATGIAAAFCFSSPAAAQQQEDSFLFIAGAPPVAARQGLSVSERFEGSSSDGANIFDLNTTVGYDFTRFFGVDVGVPVYVETPDPATTLVASQADGLGNAYLDFRFSWDTPLLHFSSIPIAAFPTARTSEGLSTGHVIVNWSNQIDRSFWRFTPYLNADPGNGLNSITYSNARIVERPFITLGNEAQFIGGTLVSLPGPVALRADAYEVVPWGEQEVISRSVKKETVVVNGARHTETYVVMTRRQGGRQLAEDDGLDAAIDVTPMRSLLFEVGYDYSAHYGLGTLFLTASCNFSNLLPHHTAARDSAGDGEDPLAVLLAPR